MAQLNGNYLNGTNIAVLGTSAHETSEIMVYEHPLFGKVRMFIKNEKAWFCGMDIATSLQYSNTRDAIARHCKSQGVVIHDVIDSMGRTQQMKFISEGNIYRLTAKSQMPKADEFESWIFDDVVPSVINTGSYTLASHQVGQHSHDVKFASATISVVPVLIEDIRSFHRDLYFVLRSKSTASQKYKYRYCHEISCFPTLS